MRQVNYGELAWQVLLTLKLDVSATTMKNLSDRRHDVYDPAMRSVAEKVAKRLGKYEILTDAPEGPPYRMFGEDGTMTEEDALRISHKPPFG